MGGFDCYCALCAGPLNIHSIRFGQSKPRALEKRRKRVEVQKRRLAGEDVHEDRVEHEDKEIADVENEEIESINEQTDKTNDDSDDEDEDYEILSESSSYLSADSITSSFDNDSDLHLSSIQDVPIPPPEPEVESGTDNDDGWSEISDTSALGDFDPHPDRDETDSMYSYSEKHSFDPSILKLSDVAWITRSRALAFNARAPGVTKAFITGRGGQYSDFGTFDVKKPGRDPNDTGDVTHYCFHSYDPDEVPAFPFHEACYAILVKSLGYENPMMVNKDALYSVMSQLVEEGSSSLDLDYGLDGGFEQFYECNPGEEVR